MRQVSSYWLVPAWGATGRPGDNVKLKESGSFVSPNIGSSIPVIGTDTVIGGETGLSLENETNAVRCRGGVEGLWSHPPSGPIGAASTTTPTAVPSWQPEIIGVDKGRRGPLAGHSAGIQWAFKPMSAFISSLLTFLPTKFFQVAWVAPRFVLPALPPGSRLPGSRCLPV